MPAAAAPAPTAAASKEEPAEVSVSFLIPFFVQTNRLACIGEAQREDHVQCHARIL